MEWEKVRQSTSVNAYNLQFYAQTVSPGNVGSRGYGFALRCVKN